MPLNTPDSVFPPPSNVLAKFLSRRSVVHSTKGIVACTQPLAAKCGIEVLEAGGNCVVSFIIHPSIHPSLFPPFINPSSELVVMKIYLQYKHRMQPWP